MHPTKKSRTRSYGWFIVALTLIMFQWHGIASAANVTFKGKTIRILVFATAGGGYDYYTRLLARHVRKNLPGNPKLLVHNMPIGYQASNTLWRSRPDGLTWGVLPREGYLGNIAGEKALEYDFSKGIPIGSMADENSLIYIRTDTGMTTVDKLIGAIKEGKNPPIMGGSDRASASFVLGSTLEYLNPEAKFKHVLGYPGGSEIDLALRKGEVQAAGRSKNSFFSRVKDLYNSREVAVMIQTGTTKRQRDPEFKDIPTFWELADTDKKKQLLSVIVVNQLAARPFWLPPGTNDDITNAIRTAFLKTVESPALIADAKKSRRHIEVLSGEEMEALYDEVFDSPEEIKATVRKLFFDQ